VAASKNHYVVKVKGNQKKLRAALAAQIETAQPLATVTTTEKNRGRYEERQVSVYAMPENLPAGWEHAQRVIHVRRITKSSGRDARDTDTDSIYMTNLSCNDAAYFAAGIRSHWGIETKLHYVKDVIMLEDTASPANCGAAAVLGIFRSLAFNIAKNTDPSLKYATEKLAALSLRELVRLILTT
jgi:predicted transposase YbfD/YdcC